MPFSVWIGLVLCNILWGANPIMAKTLLSEVSPLSAAWLRYASAFLTYLVGLFFIRRRRLGSERFLVFPMTKADQIALLAMGFMTFCFSPVTQIIGLQYSLATENAILVAMEPLLTAFLAWIILKERMNFSNSVAFSLAMCGFFFLSGAWESVFEFGLRVSTFLGFPEEGRFSAYQSPGTGHFFGNFLILISMFGEASFSTLGRKLGANYNPLRIFGTAMAIGLLFLSAITAVRFIFIGASDASLVQELASWGQMSFRGWASVVWLGPIGTTVTYLYTLYALKQVPVMAFSLILFFQPVSGAILGYFALGDRLSGSQTLGASLILVGMLAPVAIGSLLYLAKTSRREQA